jgi:hypothetical protein
MSLIYCFGTIFLPVSGIKILYLLLSKQQFFNLIKGKADSECQISNSYKIRAYSDNHPCNEATATLLTAMSFKASTFNVCQRISLTSEVFQLFIYFYPYSHYTLIDDISYFKLCVFHSTSTT